MRAAEGKLVGSGGTARVSAPTRDIGQTLKIEWIRGWAGALRTLVDGEAVVSDFFASIYGLQPGDSFRLLTPTGARPRFRVTGEFDSKLGVLGSALVTQAANSWAWDFAQTQDSVDFVETAEGADAAQIEALLTKGVELLSRPPRR